MGDLCCRSLARWVKQDQIKFWLTFCCAEFFGTPIVGLGFRISTEVGRMNVDMVWAEIVVAALAGSLSYGLLSLLERQVTFWHPSNRRKIQ